MQIDFYLVSATRRAHRLKPDRSYVIGREQGTEIQIPDGMISRKHLRLDFASERWQATDLGSRNGSFINGEPLQNQTRALIDQDRVQVGGHIFTYHMLPPGCDLGFLSQQAPQVQDDVTMGAGMSASEIFTQGAAFSGAMTEGGLFELLQFLAQTGKTGRLDLLQGNGLAASVGVQKGQVRDASCGGVTGFEALVAVLERSCDHFAFHADAALPSGKSTISGTTEGVLMELARLLDERGR